SSTPRIVAPAPHRKRRVSSNAVGLAISAADRRSTNSNETTKFHSAPDSPAQRGSAGHFIFSAMLPFYRIFLRVKSTHEAESPGTGWEGTGAWLFAQTEGLSSTWVDLYAVKLGAAGYRCTGLVCAHDFRQRKAPARGLPGQDTAALLR